MRIDLKRKPWAQKFMVIALAVAVCAIAIFSGHSALEVNAESTDTQITNSANSITESIVDEQEKNRANTGPHVFAAVTASGTWGTCSWSLSSDGVLTISAGTGANTYLGTYAPWYSQRKNIKSVKLNGEVKLSQSAEYLFADCSNLTSFDASSLDTSAVTDMNHMFYNCSSLTSLDVSNWDTSKVTNMYQMFNGCSSLTYLDVSAWSTGKVTTMLSMFYGCSKLKHMKVGTGFVFSSTGGALPSPSAANGYYISGWYTAQTGGTRRASAGGKYTIAQTEDIYAQEAPKNYHIFLNNNGGTSKWKDMLTWSEASGSDGITYHISSSTDLGPATKNGYVFDSWEYYPMINYGFNSNRVISYTNSTYTKFGIVINNSAGKRVETIINTNTLGSAKQDWICDLDSGTYAIWIGGLTDSGALRGYKATASLEKGKTYRIEYNVVSIADGKVTFKDYSFAGPGTMTTNNIIPAGYATNFYADAIWRLPEFVGWNTSPDGSGTTYKPGSTLPDGNLDLYAQWG